MPAIAVSFKDRLASDYVPTISDSASTEPMNSSPSLLAPAPRELGGGWQAMHMPVVLYGLRLILVTRLGCSANLVFMRLWLIMKHSPVSPISFVWIDVLCMSVFWQYSKTHHFT